MIDPVPKLLLLPLPLSASVVSDCVGAAGLEVFVADEGTVTVSVPVVVLWDGVFVSAVLDWD